MFSADNVMLCNQLAICFCSSQQEARIISLSEEVL